MGLPQINWSALARNADTYSSEDADALIGKWATAFIEAQHGPGVFADAVDHYISGSSGDELARLVLKRLRPPSALRRCLEILRTSDDPTSRSSAAEIAALVASLTELTVCSELLAHPDESVKRHGNSLAEALAESRNFSRPDLDPLISSLQKADTEDARATILRIYEILEENQRLAR